MDRLKDLYERSAQGKAQIVLVDGAVASGKTELLHAFGERVVESDGVLLTAAGSRAEPTVAFDALGQLFLNSRLPSGTREAVAALLAEYAAPPDAPSGRTSRGRRPGVRLPRGRERHGECRPGHGHPPHGGR